MEQQATALTAFMETGGFVELRLLGCVCVAFVWLPFDLLSVPMCLVGWAGVSGGRSAVAAPPSPPSLP